MGITRLIAAAFLGAGLAAPAIAAECSQAPVDTPCSCNLLTLHPLQGGIGLAEVADKLDKIRAKPDKERRDLEDDPIKVVRGPDHALYITDHHHGARAWLEYDASRKSGFDSTCIVQSLPASTGMAQFVATLQERRLVRLADAAGKPIGFGDLPRTLDAMRDDPYRSMAGTLRKNGDWCRYPGAVEFAEFTWADYLRSKIAITPAKVTDTKTIAAAEQISRAPGAKCLPGYVGQAPSGACPLTPPPPDPACPAP
ncbi:MAG: ParB-like protein [Acetobacteraceae bacterium]